MEAWAAMWDTDFCTRFLHQRMRMRKTRKRRMRTTTTDIHIPTPPMTIPIPMGTRTHTGTLTHTVRPRQIMGTLTRLVVVVIQPARRRPPLPPPRLVPRSRLSSTQTDLRRSPSLSPPPNHHKESYASVHTLFFQLCLQIRNKKIEQFCGFGFCCHKKKKNTRMIHKSCFLSISVNKKKGGEVPGQRERKGAPFRTS